MEYVLDAGPKAVLDAAERHMAGLGYSTKARSDNSISFEGRIAMGGGMGALTLIGALSNPVWGMGALTAHNTGNTDTTTLLVRPGGAGGRTRVIIPEDAKPSNAALKV